MALQKTLRDLQDRARNTGWRIHWIPWQAPGKPEYVYNTPLTLVTGFGGAALFLGAASHVFFPIFRSSGNSDPSPEEIYLIVFLAVCGLAIILLGRFYAAFKRHFDWQRVTARCVDREIQERSGYQGGDRVAGWEYRLLCTFDFNGRSYEVTPEPSYLVAFNSQSKLEQYLEERIQPNGTCKLWIDPSNPLHAMFHTRRNI